MAEGGPEKSKPVIVQRRQEEEMENMSEEQPMISEESYEESTLEPMDLSVASRHCEDSTVEGQERRKRRERDFQDLTRSHKCLKQKK